MSLPRQSGFTLIELMVVITVALILLGIAVPSFQTVVNSSRLTSAANEMLAALQTARTEAIRYNLRAMVCLSTNSNTATPTCAGSGATNAIGWIAFTDVDKSSAYNSSTDKLLRVATVNPVVQIRGSAAVYQNVKVFFRSDGLARDFNGNVLTGTVDMCIPTNRPSENTRHVKISGGSVAITRANTNKLCGVPADTSTTP
jgi:type IV fimbrial biogenesis protein FimT